MRSDRVLIWTIVAVLILVLIPLIGMLGMMTMHATMGTGVMPMGGMMQMGGMMSGGMMGWGLAWMILGTLALVLLIAFLIRAVARE